MSLILPALALGMTVKIGSSGGLMQQPTSHYYHAAYGVSVDLATDSQKGIVRAHYIERPEFRSLGFADKDYGWFGQVGTKVLGAKDHGLFAFFGMGRMEGYVKADPDRIDSDVNERKYALPGPTASIEYAWALGPIDLSVNHQTFIGYVSQEEVEAYVAWPYNFFMLQAGVRW